LERKYALARSSGETIDAVVISPVPRSSANAKSINFSAAFK